MTQNHKAQQKINHYWNQRAEKYHSFQVSTDRAIVDKQVWENIFRDAIGQSQRVLDVGTGSGFVAHLLADAGYSVQGIDLSSEMIRIARAHVVPEQRDQHSALDSSGGSASFSLGDALDPPFMPQSFDAVVSRYVMWTLREPTEAMRNWARLLVPGGRLAVVDAPGFLTVLMRTLPSILPKSMILRYEKHCHLPKESLLKAPLKLSKMRVLMMFNFAL